jgi:RNA polymerase sigma factor (sigma-70 family)
MSEQAFPAVSEVTSWGRPREARSLGSTPDALDRVDLRPIAEMGSISGRDYFEAALPIIEDVIRFHCSRGRLASQEREDFHSWVICKLIEKDYSRVRKFEGRSSFRTFLSVTVGHLLLDYWGSKGGRRRSSSMARLFAPDGVWLERYLQDGYAVFEAIQLVKANHHSPLSEDELHDIADQLRVQTQRPKPVPEPLLHPVPCEETCPDRLLEERADDERRRRLEKTLERALDQLPADERVVVRMRFEEGSRINEIAEAFHVPDKVFYRRFQRTLRRLRKALEGVGLDAGCLTLYEEAHERAVNFRRRSV